MSNIWLLYRPARVFSRSIHHAKSDSRNSFTERSHTCGELASKDIGKHVNLMGWVKYTRFDNKIIGISDKYGVTQCIIAKDLLTREFRRNHIPNDSVIRISGVVQELVYQPDAHIPTSDRVEVLVDRLSVISRAKKDLPIMTREEQNQHTLVNRLKHRYLDLRNEHIQEALSLRSKIYQILRRKLTSLQFTECETPTLFKRTPGGANEFVVPTQMENKFYTLTQSPQQLKQLLMIGRLDRYFQICRCYRDESGRSDRQPEFTQLDIELSFTNQDLVIKLIEAIVYDLIQNISLESHLKFDLNSIFTEEKSIPKISYHQSMKLYGTDKPDTRYEWFIHRDNRGSLNLVIPYNVEISLLEQTLDLIRSEKNLDTSMLNVNFQHITDQETSISIDNDSPTSLELMGFIRLFLAKKLFDQGLSVYKCPYKFLWVTDFPLFCDDKQTGNLEPNHHPFTAPSKETEHYLYEDPRKVIGQHYDLVLNGQEIGGGSMRINDAQLQSFILENILKLDKNNFDYFIKALDSGCPTHGGFAFGLDRLVAILLGRNSIRDVLAFPKSSSGRDLMSESPHDIDSVTKKMYHLQIDANQGFT